MVIRFIQSINSVNISFKGHIKFYYTDIKMWNHYNSNLSMMQIIYSGGIYYMPSLPVEPQTSWWRRFVLHIRKFFHY